MVWLLIYILVIPNLSWIKYQTTVTFLDVGQGDTTLIDSPNCTILIDTYGDIYTYLRTKHLDALDYLIITHGDYDHYKEVFTVMDHIAVDQLIINAYESGQFYDEIKNRYPYTKVSSGDEIRCGPIVLDVLGPIQAYSNKNNQSIVLKTYINGTHYLFAGDIEVEAEKDLSEKYGTTLKSDILKVPHHGSNTSSSLLFLNYVSPKIAVISAGRQNKFNHPHESILKRYHELGIQIYQTKLNYTITIASHRDKKYMVLVHK
ncbi:MAG: hypothetical protein CVV63_02655 [Tenericutes bacterium HGW-Tenericutes-8]|nr:MAG: hypothetical protein CVV63_02655 [Tenericutes bacterium HGW-Tenericutes-8]